MCEIYVCCYNADIHLHSKEYIPIQCGSAVTGRRLQMLGDDTPGTEGERLTISQKNACYSELTGLYWIWKNRCHDDDRIIGLCHYRRFFDFHDRHLFGFGVIRKDRTALDRFNLDIPESVKAEIERGTIVVPRPRRFDRVNRGAILSSVPEKIMQHFDSLFHDCQPRKYSEAYDEVMLRRHYLMANNMFVMTAKDVNEYCQWLFPLFEEYEKHININRLIERRFRLFGFLAERLFNVWLLAEGKKTICYPVIWFDNTPLRHSSLWHKLRTGIRMLLK